MTKNYPPGEYTVTITGTADHSVDQVTKTATFILTLVDPCDPPDSLISADFTNQEYTITNDSHPDYVHPEFEISPDFCTFEYSYSFSELLDATGQTTTAIT